MTTVFIGGSRQVSRLGAPLRARLDRIVEKNIPVLVGDANGADRAVQEYLFEKEYPRVEVFCSGRACRNNVGGWRQREISAPGRKGTYEFYAAKDRAMAREATVGLMVWDGQSAGTLLNVLRLLKQGKKAVVYESREGQFRELASFAQWEALISNCGVELRKKLKLRATLEEGDSQTPDFPAFDDYLPRRNVG